MRSNYQNGSRQQMAREQERDDRRKAEMKRSAEKAAAEAERKRLEMNGTNFPVLGGGGWSTIEPKTRTVEAKTPVFANMARDWKAADETQKILEETRRQAAMRNERNSAAPVFIYRKRESAGEGLEWDAFQEVGEEEQDPDQDWNNVTHRRKPRREMTDAEIEEKYARSGSDDDDDEHNADLFEGRRRDYNCT